MRQFGRRRWIPAIKIRVSNSCQNWDCGVAMLRCRASFPQSSSLRPCVLASLLPETSSQVAHTLTHSHSLLSLSLANPPFTEKRRRMNSCPCQTSYCIGHCSHTAGQAMMQAQSRAPFKAIHRLRLQSDPPLQVPGMAM